MTLIDFIINGINDDIIYSVHIPLIVLYFIIQTTSNLNFYFDNIQFYNRDSSDKTIVFHQFNDVYSYKREYFILLKIIFKDGAIPILNQTTTEPS